MSMSEFAWTSFETKNLKYLDIPPVGDRLRIFITTLTEQKKIHPTQKSIKLIRVAFNKLRKRGR
jgi:hypothetical protein